MNESAKSRTWWGELELSVICGKGIDIGCGPDPVTPGCTKFDREDGDANVISLFISEVFDFVYSSHCLEHMRDTTKALQEWWKLVKPGGYLFVTVPDEDHYEQGVFPSRFNDDHKATFTISKSQSWSPISYNVLELGRSLAGGEIISLCLQDQLYDRSLMSFGKCIPPFLVRLVCFLYKFRLFSWFFHKSDFLSRALTFYFPVDQTASPFNAQAQIQLIIRKKAGP